MAIEPLFLAIFDPHLLIVKSIFHCHLPGAFLSSSTQLSAHPTTTLLEMEVGRTMNEKLLVWRLEPTVRCVSDTQRGLCLTEVFP